MQRFRRALDDGQTQPAGAGAGPSATSNTRPGAASPHHADAWEDSLPAAGLTSGGDLQDAVPQLDAAAAREYRRFLAGARAINVPMWDSSMVNDLPKVGQAVACVVFKRERRSRSNTHLGTNGHALVCNTCVQFCVE